MRRKIFLGVDLVEYKKAKAFYADHGNRIKKYFTSSEVSLIQKSDTPHKALAQLLAAKEAVFKSSSLFWMGPEGFRKIRVISQKNKKPSFRPHLSFLKTKDYVIAEYRPSHLSASL